MLWSWLTLARSSPSLISHALTHCSPSLDVLMSERQPAAENLPGCACVYQLWDPGTKRLTRKPCDPGIRGSSAEITAGSATGPTYLEGGKKTEAIRKPLDFLQSPISGLTAEINGCASDRTPLACRPGCVSPLSCVSILLPLLSNEQV